jgi:hypothetical protein
MSLLEFIYPLRRQLASQSCFFAVSVKLGALASSEAPSEVASCLMSSRYQSWLNTNNTVTQYGLLH